MKFPEVAYPNTTSGVTTRWTEVDMSTALLPEVVHEIDGNPVSFYGRRGIRGEG